MTATLSADPAITALVYGDSGSADSALSDLVIEMTGRGFRLAGLLQLNRPRPGFPSCDIVLEEIASGACVPILHDRGRHARGCLLDLTQLFAAIQLVRAQLASRPDLLVLNKFGKMEARGGGFRELIAEAIDEGIDVLIAVPRCNIESWRLFTGGAAREIVLDEGRGEADDPAPVIEHRRSCAGGRLTLLDDVLLP